MSYGSIKVQWLSYTAHGRMDAQFWQEVVKLIHERGISRDDEDAVEGIVREVENRPYSPPA